MKDTGVGIPADKLPHIFDRYFQVGLPADPASGRSSRQPSAGEGAGIGLTLTRELVKLMGGDISVQSEVGKGSVFTVTLPITRQQHRQTVPLKTPPPAEPSGAPAVPTVASGQKPLLMIVEDNADMVKYLLTVFNPAYRLEVAYNGQQGIEKAIDLIPDLIVTDTMMLEKDGYALCETLKNHQLTSHIPIIMLTAKVDVEAASRACSGVPTLTWKSLSCRKSWKCALKPCWSSAASCRPITAPRPASPGNPRRPCPWKGKPSARRPSWPTSTASWKRTSTTTSLPWSS